MLMQAATLNKYTRNLEEGHTQIVGTGLGFEHTSYWYKVVTPATLRHYGIRVHGCNLAIAQN